MIDELYINGVQVDMADDSGVYLTYKGGVFSDLTKIVGNYSQTIKLPMTVRNMRIIDMCIYPSSGSRFPYIKHAGKIVRDGIEIVNYADVFLLSISDEIEVAFVWNAFSKLSNIFSGNIKLTNLNWRNEEGDLLYKFCASNDGSKDTPVIYWGVDNPPFYNPVVSTDEIFKQLKYMYNIDVLGDINFDTFVLPLTSKNVSSEQGLEKVQTRINTQPYPHPSKFYRFLLFSDEFQGQGFDIKKEIIPDIPNDIVLHRSRIRNYTGAKIGITISRFVVKIVISSEGGSVEDYDYTLHAYGDDVESDTITPRIVRHNNKRATLYYDGDMSVSGNSFVLALPYDYNVTYDFVYTDDAEFGQEDLRGYVDISRSTLISSDYYVLYCNMPDISVADVIKTICAIECMYISTPDEKTIKFNRYSDFESKKADAYDWTEKIIYIHTESFNQYFHIDGFSKKNWLKWKEDDKVVGNYDSYIYIDDEYLDDESDLFTSSFSATDNHYNTPFVPIYSIENEKLKYKDVKPRFLIRYESDGIYYTRFNGLDFKSVLTKKYYDYINYITDARQITVSVRLSPIDLKDIDLTKPVYIGQYGCYFAIMEIKTKKNNICEAKLLKM